MSVSLQIKKAASRLCAEKPLNKRQQRWWLSYSFDSFDEVVEEGVEVEGELDELSPAGFSPSPDFSPVLPAE
jgi:hypothetical protein